MTARLIAAVLLLASLFSGPAGSVLAADGCVTPASTSARIVCACCVKVDAARKEQAAPCCGKAPTAPAMPVQAPASNSGTVDALLAAVLPDSGHFLYTLPAVRTSRTQARTIGFSHVPAPLALNCIRLI